MFQNEMYEPSHSLDERLINKILEARK